jgi:hypothetical protein
MSPRFIDGHPPPALAAGAAGPYPARPHPHGDGPVHDAPDRKAQDVSTSLPSLDGPRDHDVGNIPW